MRVEIGEFDDQEEAAAASASAAAAAAEEEGTFPPPIPCHATAMSGSGYRRSIHVPASLSRSLSETFSDATVVTSAYSASDKDAASEGRSTSTEILGAAAEASSTTGLRSVIWIPRS